MCKKGLGFSEGYTYDKKWKDKTNDYLELEFARKRNNLCVYNT